MPRELKRFPKLEATREVRNISIGHPTKTDRPKGRPVSHHFISRTTLTKLGFQLLSVYDDGTSSFRDVSIAAMLADQKAGVSQILTEVIDELDRQEAAHVAEFQSERLTAVFPQTLGYSFEKLSSALLGSGPMELGSWGIESIEKAITDFRRALDRRGLEAGAMDSVDFVISELAYPVDQLKRYTHREPNDIPNAVTARIFTSYVYEKIGELKQIAQEIDESYGAV
jgi:hypothetical protein